MLNFMTRDVHHGNYPKSNNGYVVITLLNQGTAHNEHLMTILPSSICPYTGMNVEPFTQLVLSDQWNRVVKEMD